MCCLLLFREKGRALHLAHALRKHAMRFDVLFRWIGIAKTLDRKVPIFYAQCETTVNIGFSVT